MARAGAAGRPGQLAVTWGREEGTRPWNGQGRPCHAGSAGGVGSSPLQNLSGCDCCLPQGLPVLPLGQGLRLPLCVCGWCSLGGTASQLTGK